MNLAKSTHDSAIGPLYKAANEPALSYAPGSKERAALQQALDEQAGTVSDVPLVINGEHLQTDRQIRITAPHDHGHQLASASQADAGHVQSAIEAASRAHADWSRWSLQDRAAVFLKAAELLAGKHRQGINAATMLGQSKTVYQAEIDAACELIDFLRFNVQFAQELALQHPISAAGVRNMTDYRPLEGFVYAVTPFNFTAIGGNLAAAPAIMGNTVIWKPAATAALSNYRFMQVLEEAGLPPGVINFIPGNSSEVSKAVMRSPDFAGLHFTGSTAVFDQLWRQTAENLAQFKNYPRLVGETGGKDFVLAHASADIDTLATALLRGAFEYQGQKCSAASRAYIPASIWARLSKRLSEMVAEIKVGDVRDFSCFMGAVIDRKAFDRISGYIAQARETGGAQILQGGAVDASKGYFISPTIVRVEDPCHALMQEEIFGPVLTVYVYEDARWEEVLKLVDGTSPYALTGAVFARDRAAVAQAGDMLRFAAGNFYINDKPTGAVVGQQPFGGARRSGTNDKAGSPLNLLRWVSPRTVKETFCAPVDYRYPHMD